MGGWECLQGCIYIYNILYKYKVVSEKYRTIQATGAVSVKGGRATGGGGEGVGGGALM